MAKAVSTRKAKTAVAGARKPVAGQQKAFKKTAGLAAGGSGCTFVPEWRMLTNTKGMTQVWIPTAEYKRIAAGFAKLTASRAMRANLRARRQAIGVTHTCKGTCGGGWCKEVEIPQPELSLVTVCECSYFV